MIKQRFRQLARSGDFNLVTAKVLRPDAGEVAHNLRARSARLRCIERRPK
jgi:16S rRNA C1402 N4-methylase RsmH